MEGPAALAGALGRGEDAGAGETDRAHGGDRGRPGRTHAHHGDRHQKNAKPWGGQGWSLLREYLGQPFQISARDQKFGADLLVMEELQLA